MLHISFHTGHAVPINWHAIDVPAMRVHSTARLHTEREGDRTTLQFDSGDVGIGVGTKLFTHGDNDARSQIIVYSARGLL